MANYKFVDADQLDADLEQVGNAIREKGGTSERLAFPSGMVSAIGKISTGVELNFDVVPYATEPDLLAATPKENTIGIITSTEITDWVFSATQPTGVPGRIWISIGTSSTVEFNALKKNGIQVYPISAKQYISGAWVDKEAKSYQGGEWADWVTYLYKHGDECLELTGGWALSSNVERNSNPTLVKNATSMTFSTSFVTDSHFADGFLRCNNKIDLTEKSTITVFLESANISTVGMGLCISKTDSSIAQTYAAASAAISNNAEVVSLDVSELTGTYYVGICAITSNEAATSTVKVAAIAVK